MRSFIVGLLLSLMPFAAFADSQGSATGGTRGSQSTLSGATYNTSAPTLTNGQQAGLQADVNGNLKVTGSITTTPAAVATPASASLFPFGSTPITASATGTTAATTATLAAAAAKTTYICGFSIRASATAAATGNATVTGTITGTLNFTQWTAPAATAIGTVEERFYPCVPASGANTGIATVSAAPGTGGVVSVSAWGYQQ